VEDAMQLNFMGADIVFFFIYGYVFGGSSTHTHHNILLFCPWMEFKESEREKKMGRMVWVYSRKIHERSFWTFVHLE